MNEYRTTWKWLFGLWYFALCLLLCNGCGGLMLYRVHHGFVSNIRGETLSGPAGELDVSVYCEYRMPKYDWGVPLIFNLERRVLPLRVFFNVVARSKGNPEILRISSAVIKRNEDSLSLVPPGNPVIVEFSRNDEGCLLAARHSFELGDFVPLDNQEPVVIIIKYVVKGTSGTTEYTFKKEFEPDHWTDFEWFWHGLDI